MANMTDKDTMIEMGLDSRQVLDGFKQVEKAAEGTAQKIGQEGEKASKGLEKIGDGAKGAAEKMDRGTKSIIASIERATAAAKAGERGTAAYFEAIAQQRGVSSDALRPYIEQLRQAEAAQRKAEGSLQTMGVSAAQTAAALRQVPAQFTDIATSLASGQAPLTVLLQQGGQLKDSFGGAGAAAQALGKYVIGLVNPVTAAAAAAAAFGLAFRAGASEGEKFRETLILTGGAIGQTSDQLSDMAARIGDIKGTQGQAAEALNALAASGRVGAASLEKVTLAAVRLQSVGGPSIEETTKALERLGESPAKAAAALNETFNFLTAAQYKQIQSLEAVGQKTEAARLAQEAYADAIELRVPLLEQNLGLIEKAWRSVAAATKEAWDFAKNIGRDDTLSEQIAALEKREQELLRLSGGRLGRTGANEIELSNVRGSITALKEQQREQQRLNDLKADANRREQAGVRFADELVSTLSKQEKLEQEILRIRNLGAKAQADPGDIEKLVKAARERAKDAKSSNDFQRALEKEASLLEKVVGLSGSYYEDLNELFKLYKGGKISVDEYRAAVEKLNTQQPVYKEQADALKKLREEAARTSKEWIDGQQGYDKWVESLRKGGDQVDAQVQKLKDESQAAELAAAKNISLAQAIEEVAIARLREKREKSSSSEEIAAIDREIAKRRELVNLIGSKEAQEANKKAADNMQKEFERVAGQIEQSLSDALMQGGKSAAEYLKGLFRQLVLRPLLQPLVQPIAGLIAGASGTGGQAQGSNLMGMAQQGYSLYNMLSGTAAGSAIFGNAAAYGAAIGTTSIGAGSQAAMLAAQTGEFGLAGFQATSSAAATAGGTGASAIGSNLASFGPYAALIAAGMKLSGDAYDKGFSENSLGLFGKLTTAGLGLKLTTNALEKLGVSSRTANILTGASLAGSVFGRAAPRVESTELVGSFTGGDFTGNLQANILEKGGLFRSDKRSTQTSALSSDLEKALDESGKQLADLAKKYGTALGLPVDQLASVNQTIRVKLTDNAEDNSKAIEDALKQYSDALLKGFSGDLEPLRKSGETLAQTIERVGTSLLGVNESLQLLGLTALDASIAGGDAATKLAEQFGGLSNLANLTGDYYQRYYSEAERAASATQTIAGELEKLGIAMPASREQFRALVEAQDLTTESGQRTFAALLGIAGVFDEVSAASERAAEKVKQEREALDQAITGTLPKFLSDMEKQAFEYQRIAAQLAKQGVAVSVDSLMSATKDEILEFARTFVSLDANSNEAKLAIVNLAGALADLKGTALDFVQIGSQRFDASEFQRKVQGISQADILESIQKSFSGADLDRAMSNFNVGSSTFLGAYANSLAAGGNWYEDYIRTQNAAESMRDQTPYAGAGGSAMEDAQRENTEALKRLTQTLQEDLQSLLVGDVSALNPEEQLKAARAEFDRLNAAAEAGNVEAAGQVGGAAREFLQLAQQFSPGQYPKVFDEILTQMRELLSAAQSGNQINVVGFGSMTRAAQEGVDATYAVIDNAALDRQRTVGLEL